MTHRRSFLTGLGAGLVLSAAGATASFAGSSTAGRGQFVLVILRGAMDGLAAVPPVGDRQYRDLRGALALEAAGAPDGVLPLADGFGLHPALSGLHDLWAARELSVMHACATPYRDRSHFDGQDVLEGGTDRLFATSGWLGRSLGLLSGTGPAVAGVAIARTIPLVLRGAAGASSWTPGVAPDADPEMLARLMDLYADDPLLGPALARAVETDAIADGMTGSTSGRGGRGGANGAYVPIAQAAARILSAPEAPAAAVLSFDGWDTHANQGAGRGLLAGRLQALDQALTALRTGLGPRWERTAVVVATEFGRTVRVNGTGGTDHGTGGAAFALGGAMAGLGGLTGDWPGLSRLYQDRDLTPANDIRTLFATAMEAAWGLPRESVLREVFAART